ncbi:MAG TPA: DMT family transporter [Planctomycetota bacterium]
MRTERRATLWLLAMCVIWGASFPVMKRGMDGLAAVVGSDAAPAAFLFPRFLVAAAVFPLVFTLRGLTPAAVRAGALLSIPFSAGFLMQVWGLRSTTPAVSAFLTNLTVIATPLVGTVAFGERLTRGNAAGAAIAVVGVWFLAGPGGGRFGAGEAITVLSTLAWAVQIQMTQGITRRHSPEAVTFVLFVGAALASGLALAATGVDPRALARAAAAPDVGWTVLFTALVCSVLATTVMNRYQRDLAPTRAAVIYTLEPVFAVALSTALVLEPLTAAKVVGGTIILVGNVACELWPYRQPGSETCAR